MKTFLLSLFLLFVFLLPYKSVFAADLTVDKITVIMVDTFAMKGMPAQPVIKINIKVTGTTGALNLQKLIVRTANQDNTDIDSIAVYKTKAYNRFSLAEYPAEASLVGKKRKIVNDTIQLSSLLETLYAGDNYFWVTMNLSKYSKASHTLDALIPANGIQIGGSLYPASNESPDGNISIHQIYFKENFESYNAEAEPGGGWLQEKGITAIKKWICHYGGYSISTFGHPIAPKSGVLNVMLQKVSDNADTVILVSKALDLSLASTPVLSFYHAQVPWNKGSGKIDQDVMRVVYRIGSTGTWKLLKSYDLAASTWLKREIVLPEEASAKNVYLGFQGIAKWGWGVCLDSLVIYESTVVNRELKDVVIDQHTTDIVPQGSGNNPVARVNIRIKGNTGNITLNSIKVTSANTTDNDISTAGVKLYYTNDSVFTSPVLCGSAQSFAGDRTVTFSGLNKILETGDNYYWVTYDVKPDAKPGNTLDLIVKAGDISLSAGVYPSADQSPIGSRTIKQTIFADDFEGGTTSWTFTGLFQTGQPMGLGGTQCGMPDPTSAYSENNVLGTALSPTGDYENNVTAANAYTATSPLIDARYFKNLRLDFYRWLNLDNNDSAYLSYRFEDEPTWTKLWSGGKKYIESQWGKQTFINLSKLQRKKIYFRFQLGPTDAINKYSGWNIDYFFLTADSIPMDASVTELEYPLTSCNLSAHEYVKVRVKNTGPNPLVNTPVKLSIDGGKYYITETVPGPINPGESVSYTFTSGSDFSKFSVYTIIVKTAHPRDNYTDNDSIVKEIASLPTYSLPYKQGFEKDSTFWMSGGLNSSWYRGAPNGYYINAPAEGSKFWKTDRSGYHNLYENSYLQSPCFSFTGKAMPMVDFQYSVVARSQVDGAILQYSTDDGQTWLYVPKDSYSFPWNWYNDTVTTLKHKGWTGRTVNGGGTQEWRVGRQLLPLSVANQSKVRLRVVFKSDSTTTERMDGFAIDDFKVFNAPFDLGVTSINGITHPACQYQNSPFLNVTIKNFGYQQMQAGDTIIVGAMVNGAVQAVDTFKLTGPLAKDATLTHTFTKKVNFNASGNYTIKAFTMVEKDKSFYNTDNDTSTISFAVNMNPVTKLRKSYYTSRLDTLDLAPFDSSAYSYYWKHNASTSTSRIYAAHEVGTYYLTVTRAVTGCQTKDTILVGALSLDAGVSEIVAPVTGACGYTTSFHPVIKIKNFGTDTLVKNRTIPINIRLNSNAMVHENVILSKVLPPNGIYIDTLNWSADFLTAGTSELMIGTDMSPYDVDNSNDSIKKPIVIKGIPLLELGPDVYVKAVSHTLKLIAGYSKYQWSEGSDKDSLVVTTSGKYKVTVTNTNLCEANDSINVMLGIHDLKVKRLVTPQNSCIHSTPAMSTISCKLMNNGTDTIRTGETIAMQYSVNSGTAVNQSFAVANDIKPGDSIDFTFTQQQSMNTPNTYSIKIKATLANDIRRENDSIIPVVKVYNNPVIDLGSDVDPAAYEKKLAPGNYTKYKWQDGSTDPDYLITLTHFQEDGLYSVTVTDENGCEDSDTIVVHLQAFDLKVKEIMMPETTCMKAADTLSIKIRNTGNRIMDHKTFALYYSLNGAQEEGGSFTFTGNPGDEVIYKLSSWPAKIRQLGLNKITVRLDSKSFDVRDDNDTLTHFVQVLYGAIVDFGAVHDTLMTDLPHTLDAGSGTNFVYAWSTGETSQAITATQSKTYTVTITTGACVTEKSVIVVDKVYDLSVSNVVVPTPVCVGPQKKAVKVEVENSGNMTLTDQPVVIKYQLNSGAEKTKNVTFTGKANEKVEYTFNDSIDVSQAAENNIVVGMDYTQDENAANNSKSAILSVKAKPVVGFSSMGDKVTVNSYPYTLDAGSGTGYAYKWQDNSELQNYTVAQDGTYSVTITDGPCTVSDTITVTIFTSVQPVTDAAKLVVYPNPAHEVVNINLLLTNNKDIVLEFVSASGKVISSRDLSGSRQYTQTIDVTHLQKGLYYVRVRQNNSWIGIQKVVIQ